MVVGFARRFAKLSARFCKLSFVIFTFWKIRKSSEASYDGFPGSCNLKLSLAARTRCGYEMHFYRLLRAGCPGSSGEAKIRLLLNVQQEMLLKFKVEKADLISCPRVNLRYVRS